MKFRSDSVEIISNYPLGSDVCEFVTPFNLNVMKELESIKVDIPNKASKF